MSGADGAYEPLATALANDLQKVNMGLSIFIRSISKRLSSFIVMCAVTTGGAGPPSSSLLPLSLPQFSCSLSLPESCGDAAAAPTLFNTTVAPSVLCYDNTAPTAVVLSTSPTTATGHCSALEEVYIVLYTEHTK